MLELALELTSVVRVSVNVSVKVRWVSIRVKLVNARVSVRGRVNVSC